MSTKTDKMNLDELIGVASELLKLAHLELAFPVEQQSLRAFDRGFLSKPEDDVLRTLFNVQDRLSPLIKEIERLDKHVETRAFELIIKHKVLPRYLEEKITSGEAVLDSHIKRCEELCQKFKVNPYDISEE
ncbi:MAG: hypothetical protein OXH71_01540 [Candidatus Dadabacteria bacterium]|nr:hypothetical protein [Candidatus Dadabacteria bacterium]MDE0519373.1 hypothetical protein [Candidatus Dadabacteria bacterium]MDE0663743.1 hypothetical protein [Candidatus Dadabacteria bacterium]